MTQETKTPKPSATPAAPAGEDLSEAIAAAVETQSDEEANVVRVFGDRYRCNWWVRERASHWLSFATGTIRRSKFFRASRTAEGLQIEELRARR